MRSWGGGAGCEGGWSGEEELERWKAVVRRDFGFVEDVDCEDAGAEIADAVEGNGAITSCRGIPCFPTPASAPLV